MSDLVHVKGLKELQAFMDQLPAKMEANVMRSSMRAGANVIRDEARANVPAKTGLLRAGIKVSTNSRRGVVKATIRAGGKHAYIAKFVEYGTAAHFIKPKKAKSLFIAGLMRSGVEHPGASPKPFMRPALDSQAQAALVAVAQAMKKRLATKHGLNTADVEIG